jgi:hypothetical protein
LKHVQSQLLTLLLMSSPVVVLAQLDCNHPENVARIDLQAKRLFALGTEDQIATPTDARGFLKPLANYVLRCQSRWANEWSISIFTERGFALYKTEIQNPVPNAAQKWADSYIGEYSRRDQKLVLHPLSPKDKKWIRIANDE